MTALRDFQIPGAEIRAVRSFWGDTRRDFAEYFDVHRSTVQAWEREGVTRRNQKFNRSTFYLLKLPALVFADAIE